jgi:hypothetical protein
MASEIVEYGNSSLETLTVCSFGDDLKVFHVLEIESSDLIQRTRA